MKTYVIIGLIINMQLFMAISLTTLSLSLSLHYHYHYRYHCLTLAYKAWFTSKKCDHEGSSPRVRPFHSWAVPRFSIGEGRVFRKRGMIAEIWPYLLWNFGRLGGPWPCAPTPLEPPLLPLHFGRADPYNYPTINTTRYVIQDSFCLIDRYLLCWDWHLWH